jgi:hypothetical protein
LNKRLLEEEDEAIMLDESDQESKDANKSTQRPRKSLDEAPVRAPKRKEASRDARDTPKQIAKSTAQTRRAPESNGAHDTRDGTFFELIEHRLALDMASLEHERISSQLQELAVEMNLAKGDINLDAEAQWLQDKLDRVLKKAERLRDLLDAKKRRDRVQADLEQARKRLKVDQARSMTWAASFVGKSLQQLSTHDVCSIMDFAGFSAEQKEAVINYASTQLAGMDGRENIASFIAKAISFTPKDRKGKAIPMHQLKTLKWLIRKVEGNRSLENVEYIETRSTNDVVTMLKRNGSSDELITKIRSAKVRSLGHSNDTYRKAGRMECEGWHGRTHVKASSRSAK